MSYMLDALNLAEKGRFTVAPNPLVGCVIEKNNKVIGRGFHQKAGFDHAEIIALREAGAEAKGANVYVTLEPCSHFGRTPPCVDALIKAEVNSVHIPFIDPNPLVAGQGIAKLKSAGIKVFIGEEAELAKKQNEVFLFYITQKRPFVIAKWAMTLDGRIATDSNDSKWISSQNSRKKVHFSRAEMGALVVGVNTIIHDDPKLTPYLIDDGNKFMANPLRVILDSKGQTPLSAAVVNDKTPHKTIIAVTELTPKNWRQQMQNKGVEILVLPKDKDNYVSVLDLLTELGKRQISGLLVEGGQKVFTSFFAANIVNKIHVYIAPKIIGGLKNFSPLGNLNIKKIFDAKKFVVTKNELIDSDMFLELQGDYVYRNN